MRVFPSLHSRSAEGQIFSERHVLSSTLINGISSRMLKRFPVSCNQAKSEWEAGVSTPSLFQSDIMRSRIRDPEGNVNFLVSWGRELQVSGEKQSYVIIYVSLLTTSLYPESSYAFVCVGTVIV